MFFYTAHMHTSLLEEKGFLELVHKVKLLKEVALL